MAMNLRTEFMWKDANSNVGDCPSLNRVIEGPDGYVVVGKNVDAETRAQIPQVGDDETAVFVPANVINRIRDLA